MILAHFMQLFINDWDSGKDNVCDKCWLSIMPLVLLGMSYASYAIAQWGSLPYLVEKKTLGTAFGICNVFENIGTVLTPPILGMIEEATPD